ncbi:MAG: molybdopterin molybdotransferase MoeA [Deltaproteobacteria bacterium]|nr:molybdopterin molybdotransferase MoeA [Deltaproteobacteria bacterium]
MIAVSEAHGLIEQALWRPEAERVALQEASGRVLAEPLVAPFGQPRFTNSAMDGFAVRAAELEGATAEAPVLLERRVVVGAGHPTSAALGPGECAQIMTGAPLPEGADAVVMVEQTSGFERTPVTFSRPARAGQNVRREGEELEAGTTVLAEGTCLGAAELGVATSFGWTEARVWRRPRVALLCTGDELRSPGEPLGPGEIYDSNLTVLGELLRVVGAEVVTAERVRDDRPALETAFRRASERAEVVVSSGGVSMGQFDFVREVVVPLGFEQRFWKVAQKPGKPLLFAAGPGRAFFGLPGNPVSSLVCFLEYVWPALARLSGRPLGEKVSARLVGTFPREGKLHRFLFGRVWVEREGLYAAATPRHGSHMLTAALGANALLEAGPGAQDLTDGEALRARLLPGAHVAGSAKGS